MRVRISDYEKEQITKAFSETLKMLGMINNAGDYNGDRFRCFYGFGRFWVKIKTWDRKVAFVCSVTKENILSIEHPMELTFTANADKWLPPMQLMYNIARSKKEEEDVESA